MKKFLNILLASILTVTISACTDTDSNGKETVKIGLSAPLSGDQAVWGEPLKQAIEMAKENLQKDTKYNYEVIFEDDKFSATMAATVANKFASIDKVDAIISLSSGVGNSIAPIAQNNKIIHFGIASDPNVAKGNYNFIHWTPPVKEVQKLIEELNKRNITKVGAFYMNHQGALAIINPLKEQIEGTNIKIVSDNTFNGNEKDFKTMIQKAKREDPQIYLLIAFTPELEILTKQIREAGIDKPLTSVEAFLLTDQTQLFEGLWFVDAGVPTAEFAKKFKEYTGKNPGPGSPNVYDAFNILVNIYENYQSETKPTTTQIAEELSKLKDYEGVLGTLNVNEEGIILSEASVKIIKNGEGVVIED